MQDHPNPSEQWRDMPPDFIPFAQTELERFALRVFRRLDESGKTALLDGLRKIRDEGRRHGIRRAKRC